MIILYSGPSFRRLALGLRSGNHPACVDVNFGLSYGPPIHARYPGVFYLISEDLHKTWSGLGFVFVFWGDGGWDMDGLEGVVECVEKGNLGRGYICDED
jgi:hypothetical protein